MTLSFAGAFGARRVLAARAACVVSATLVVVLGHVAWEPTAYAAVTSAVKLPKGILEDGRAPRDGGILKGDGVHADRGRDLTGRRDETCEQCLKGDIACGQTISGSLAAGDCLVAGCYADAYRIVLAERARLTVNLTSGSFDTYLLIVDATCTKLVAENDDCGSTEESCLARDLDAGMYFIFATSYSSGELGSYSLSATCPPPLCESCVSGTIACGQTLGGALSSGDCDLGDGTYVDLYRFDLPQRSFVTINMRSIALDSFLLVASESCEWVGYNDDCDETLSSCVTMYMEAGTYFIFANSYDVDTGPYELEIAECVCPAPESPDEPFPADLARNVPTAVSLAWNWASAPAGRRASRTRIIYGTDDRVEEYEVTDTRLRAIGDATVVIVSRSMLTNNNDGTYSLPASTFAQEYLAATGRPLCADERFRDQPIPGWCSGALVDSQLVFTAGHCITGGGDCADAAFVFGFVMTDAASPVVRVPASEVYFCAGILARAEADADWGLILLDRPVVGHQPLAVRRAGAPAVGESVMAIGHPVGLPRKYAGGATIREASSPDYFQANLDVYGGNSGSAVINTATLEVEGILVRGYADFREAGECDRSNVCPDTGCPGWEDVTRATAFSFLLPSFDVYLGRNADALALVASGLGTPRYEPGPLAEGARYYWQVAATNSCAAEKGPVWSFTTAGVSTEKLFRRGDANSDGTINVADAIFNLMYAFRGGAAPSCMSAGDANDDGAIDLADAIRILGYLFASTGPLPAPLVACGIDPTADELDCLVFEPCQ